MSQYNHFCFLKLDPLGELTFMFNKLCKGMYVFVTTTLVDISLLFAGVKFGKRVKFRGLALVERFQCSTIEIGDNCTFNSPVVSIFAELIISALFRQANPVRESSLGSIAAFRG